MLYERQRDNSQSRSRYVFDYISFTNVNYIPFVSGRIHYTGIISKRSKAV